MENTYKKYQEEQRKALERILWEVSSNVASEIDDVIAEIMVEENGKREECEVREEVRGNYKNDAFDELRSIFKNENTMLDAAIAILTIYSF
jgi:hypothetical protein